MKSFKTAEKRTVIRNIAILSLSVAASVSIFAVSYILIKPYYLGSGEKIEVHAPEMSAEAERPESGPAYDAPEEHGVRLSRPEQEQEENEPARHESMTAYKYANLERAIDDLIAATED